MLRGEMKRKDKIKKNGQDYGNIFTQWIILFDTKHLNQIMSLNTQQLAELSTVKNKHSYCKNEDSNLDFRNFSFSGFVKNKSFKLKQILFRSLVIIVKKEKGKSWLKACTWSARKASGWRLRRGLVQAVHRALMTLPSPALLTKDTVVSTLSREQRWIATVLELAVRFHW